MERLCVTKFVQQFCRLSGKWVIVLYPNHEFGFEELQKAAPFITISTRAETDGTAIDDIQAVMDGEMMVVCDSKKECEELFNQIVCDGPTQSNPYDGPCKVYAWTCGPDGQILNENT